MRQFKQYVDLLDGADLKGTNDKINQTQRNEIKAYGLSAIERDLVENGLTVHRTKDGLVVEIPNNEFGVIYSVIDFKIKNLDYDVDGAVAEYNEAIAERERKVLEKAAKVKKVKGE